MEFCDRIILFIILRVVVKMFRRLLYGLYACTPRFRFLYMHIQYMYIYVQFSFIHVHVCTLCPESSFVNHSFQAHLRRWVDVLVTTVTAKAQRKGDVSDWNYYL